MCSGAFFNMTGMSHCFHDADKGHYGIYPTAFGDTLTGTNMLACISMALAARVENGWYACVLDMISTFPQPH